MFLLLWLGVSFIRERPSIRIVPVISVPAVQLRNSTLASAASLIHALDFVIRPARQH